MWWCVVVCGGVVALVVRVYTVKSVSNLSPSDVLIFAARPLRPIWAALKRTNNKSTRDER